MAEPQSQTHQQVPQHNQAVLPQGRRRGGDVRRHRGGELQGCATLAHQCPGLTFDPWTSSATLAFFMCRVGRLSEFIHHTLTPCRVYIICSRPKMLHYSF